MQGDRTLYPRDTPLSMAREATMLVKKRVVLINLEEFLLSLWAVQGFLLNKMVGLPDKDSLTLYGSRSGRPDLTDVEGWELGELSAQLDGFIQKVLPQCMAGTPETHCGDSPPDGEISDKLIEEEYLEVQDSIGWHGLHTCASLTVMLIDSLVLQYFPQGD